MNIKYVSAKSVSTSPTFDEHCIFMISLKIDLPKYNVNWGDFRGGGVTLDSFGIPLDLLVA